MNILDYLKKNIFNHPGNARRVADLYIEKNKYVIGIRGVEDDPPHPPTFVSDYLIMVNVYIPRVNSSKDLVDAIKTIKVGGTANNPRYDINGQEVICNKDFDKIEINDDVWCDNIVGLPMTIFDKVKSELISSPSGVTIAKVLIEKDKMPYDIILKESLHSTHSDPLINKEEHKITVELRNKITSVDQIDEAINTIEIGGTANLPTYIPDGLHVVCPGNFNTLIFPNICHKVTGLPYSPKRQIVQDVLDSINDDKMLNGNNVIALKNIDDDILEYCSVVAITAFVKSTATHLLHMSGDKLEKVLKCYIQIEDATELSSDHVENAVTCILYGE